VYKVKPKAGAGQSVSHSRYNPRRRVSITVTFAALLLAAGLSTPATAKSRNCTAAERADGDKWLWLSPSDKDYSIRRQLPWGAPVANQPSPNEILLVQRDYVNSYNTDLRVPIWSAERLDAKRLGKVKDRINCFRADPRLTTAQASTPSDYDEPIYDQGHLSPDADQDSSKRAAVNTYIMSNMAPETCQFNRGIWQILEGITRGWSRSKKTLYVMIGSVFDRDGDGARDPDEAAPRMVSRNGQQRVAIPSAFYRISALKRADGSLEVLSILLPHDTANPDGDEALSYLRDHITTIAKIEALTGLKLFPTAAHIEEASTLWPLAEKAPHSLCHQ